MYKPVWKLKKHFAYQMKKGSMIPSIKHYIQYITFLSNILWQFLSRFESNIGIVL